MLETYNLAKLDKLCVDNNRNMHQILRTFLSAMQIEVTRFCVDAADAFSKMQERMPNIVITELEMDPLDGFDFIKLIRRGDDSPDIYVPILVLTAHTELNHIIRARNAGATEILAKPVSVDSLYGRLIWMADNPRPLIVAKGFVGPDRRRAMRGYEGLEKRENDEESGTIDDEREAAPQGDPG
ncbi:MAG: response regulator [Alphaproteobacteria bacterium]